MLKKLSVRLVPFVALAAIALSVGAWSKSAPTLDLRPVPLNPRHRDPGAIIIVADGEGIWSRDEQDPWTPPPPGQARYSRR